MKNALACRIVFTVGGKGGVGKSWVVSLLAQWLEVQETTYVLFDCDDETSTTSRFFPEAQYLTIRSSLEIDQLVQAAVNGKHSVVLVDLPARAGDEFQRWFSLVPWADLAALGIRFTAIGVVSGAKDSIEAVLRWREFLGNNVDHLLALNHRDDLSIFSASRAREKLQAEGISEILIPKMDERFAAELDRANWTISQALQQKEPHFLTQLMSRSRLRRYRESVFQQFDAVKFLIVP